MQSQLQSRFWALRWVNRAPDSLRTPGHGKNLTYEIHMNSQWTFASTGVFKMSVCISLYMLVLMSLLVSPLKKDARKLRGSKDKVVTHPTLHMIKPRSAIANQGRLEKDHNNGSWDGTGRWSWSNRTISKKVAVVPCRAATQGFARQSALRVIDSFGDSCAQHKATNAGTPRHSRSAGSSIPWLLPPWERQEKTAMMTLT